MKTDVPYKSGETLKDEISGLTDAQWVRLRAVSRKWAWLYPYPDGAEDLLFETIAAVFQASLTSTAIRLVEGGHSPAVLICHGKRGRRWFTRSPDVPRHWFPRDEFDAESSAFDVLHGSKAAEAFPSKIGADAWFDRWDAERYMVQEQSIQTTPDEILNLVLIKDAAMLEESER